jgi:DNA-binding protein
MSGKKSRDADEIFSQFEKHKEESVKPEEKVQQEPPQEPQLEPSIVQEEPVQPSEEPDEPQPSQEPEIAADEEAVKTRNVIFVGIKPIMTYVTATLTQLASSPTVTIKARGKRITQAVDVSQMIVKRMDSVGYKVTDVRISSDSLLSQDGKMRNVSTIEVDVTKVDS